MVSSPLPLGPEELAEIDQRMARRDPAYRGWDLETWVRRQWWKVTRWALRRQGKGMTERERVRRRG
jgi:hypothetical protein